MKRRIKVYIAGPYTKGDIVKNVRRAMLVGSRLWRRGLAPYIPHLTMFQHMLSPMEYEDWMSWDLQWLPCCDVLLRLSGESPGANKEIERFNGIVFNTETELMEWFEKKELKNESK